MSETAYDTLDGSEDELSVVMGIFVCLCIVLDAICCSLAMVNFV